MKQINNTFDISALGECLVDFVHIPDKEMPLLFSGNAGGAPANVLACATKFGMKCAFIGKVGNDVFGRYLKRTIEQNGIDVTGMVISLNRPTTLAFINRTEDGDRDFSFYRNGTADCLLSPKDINTDIILNSKLFHFGSISMTNSQSRAATLYACRLAQDNGVLTSFDPNFRETLWKTKEQAKETIKSSLAFADIVKFSDHELSFLMEEEDLSLAAKKLFNSFQNIKILCITKGSKGAICQTRYGKCAQAPAYAVDTIDTTGAGDAFFGAFLVELLKTTKKLEDLTDDDFLQILHMANACGSLATTKHGAIPAIPTPEEVISCIHTIPCLP